MMMAGNDGVKSPFRNKKLLVGLTVVVLLAGALAFGMISVQRGSDIDGYRQAMRTVEMAAKACVGSGGVLVSGNPGDPLCLGNADVRYPVIAGRCSAVPRFTRTILSGNPSLWEVTTTEKDGTTPWSCAGCRLRCSVNGCVATPGSDCG